MFTKTLKNNLFAVFPFAHILKKKAYNMASSLPVACAKCIIFSISFLVLQSELLLQGGLNAPHY